jgi:Family of unknown function (DUF6519)
MQGEFRGDFTRDTFNPEKHFLRVFTQQGRVQLDADPNEQSSILIHYLQSLAVDLMGPHAAPFEGGGFEILTAANKIEELKLDPTLTKKLEDSLNKNGFIITKGKYYVNGILCENDGYIPFFSQPALPFPLPQPLENSLQKDKKYLIYLDVWERHINYIQDEILSGNNIQEDPSIREVALAGVDTATRSKIVWQVKVKSVSDEEIGTAIVKQGKDLLTSADIKKYSEAIKNDYSKFLTALGESIEHPGRKTGKLKARAKKSDLTSNDPCIVNPNSSYQGSENQLYRVEIHYEGTGKKEYEGTGKKEDDNISKFKWSRENSSVVFPIRNLVISSGSSQNITISLAHLGRDHRFTLEDNDWVEIVDDDYIVQNNPTNSPLLKIDSIDRDEQTIVLSGTIQNGLGQNPAKHPFLRRWDRDEKTAEVAKDNGVQVVEECKWLLLENGIEIYFSSSSDSIYRKGDYWLIPARTATGDVEWPGTVDKPTPLPPHGIIHSYAPLALISVGTGNSPAEDCRRKLTQQW